MVAPLTTHEVRISVWKCTKIPKVGAQIPG